MQAPYTDYDIRYLYRTALNKPEEIRILAQLCDTTVRYIEGVIGKKKPIPYEPSASNISADRYDYTQVHKLLKNPLNTYADISSVTLVPIMTISWYYRQNIECFPDRKKNGRPKHQDERVVKWLMNPSLTYKQIAEMANTSVGTIQRYARQYADILPKRQQYRWGTRA